jgi:Flp pilus assembly protein TadG
MATPVSARRSRQKGSAMVELALCLMGFLLLTMGSMEFGWGIYAYNFCSFAAQDAARWGSVRGSLSTSPATTATITSFVQSEAVGLDTSLITVTSTWNPDNTPGSTLTVTVGYTIKPLAGIALKQNILVSSTAQFVVNN